MTGSVRRGQWLFFVIVIPVALLESANLVLAFLRPWNEISWFRGVIIPAVLLLLCYSLWFGSRSTRSTLAIWLGLKGLVLSAIIFAIANAMFKETPPEAMQLLFQIMLRVAGVIAVGACFYFWAGLTVWLSPSLRKFLDLQEMKEQELGVSPFAWLRRRSTHSLVHRYIGELPLPSRVLLLADPKNLPGLSVTGFGGEAAYLFMTQESTPPRYGRVHSVRVMFETADEVRRRRLGEVPIDTARLVLVDQGNYDRDWNEEGPMRRGIIVTRNSDDLIEELHESLGVEIEGTFSGYPCIKGPVSEELEAEIRAYIASNPKYPDYFTHFEIATDSSLERALCPEDGLQPIADRPKGLFFVCGAGYGDGTYDVIGEFANERLVALEINFLTEEEAKRVEASLPG
ncbi:hypothetical protein LOC68_27600 [Blastopirellula sp. JC732]|uniref:Uncharacterized protein n=1 Tax=Blastopirellula sediminis TaxID=2894196 RepID=A0A9X1MRF4_9BACT|nr:hypothetical protein [Blastopirellula sediminis]MCC9604523.1 hypothetical protein [Blastopirellula sediminis]MCC9632178.1 hypothetical protein [Blastopirellula sediminis]